MIAISCFLSKSNDGTDESWYCDDTLHYQYVDGITGCLVSETDGVREMGCCDGSCKPEARQVNLSDFVHKRAAQMLEVEDEKVLPSVLEMEPSLKDLFSHAEPVMGTQFERWYSKRSGEGCLCCIGARHIQVSIHHDWWSGDLASGRYETIRVTSTPCDGSCTPQPVELPLLAD